MNLAEALDWWDDNPYADPDEIGPIIAAARRLLEARQLVDTQAEDDALWFLDVTAPEAYLQQELRRLHAIVEPIDR